MAEIIVFNHLTGDMATVSMEHDDTVIDVVDDGYGGVVNVYKITDLKYINPQGFPMLFTVTPDGEDEIPLTIGANQDGEKHIPTPNHFRHYPCTFRLSRR